MLRARKVLGDKGKIDHHADHGFVSSSPVMNYMELYPFINRLWYGEGFDYNTCDADYWLIEIAGFETGVSQDLLRYTSMQHDHGMTRYQYRGMLTASSVRHGIPACHIRTRVDLLMRQYITWVCSFAGVWTDRFRPLPSGTCGTRLGLLSLR